MTNPLNNTKEVSS